MTLSISFFTAGGRRTSSKWDEGIGAKLGSDLDSLSLRKNPPSPPRPPFPLLFHLERDSQLPRESAKRRWERMRPFHISCYSQIDPISLQSNASHLQVCSFVLNELGCSLQRSAKRCSCLLIYSQAEPGRELTQPRPRLLAAEPCTVVPTLIRDGPPANGQSNLMKSFPVVILVDLGSSVQVGFST